jgi:hypothetical protein
VKEVILNALFANADMTGQGGSFVPTLAHDWLAATFRRSEPQGLLLSTARCLAGRQVGNLHVYKLSELQVA